jgi:hypothetical protein
VRVFSPDGVHPYPETGHIIYAETLKRSFEKMFQNRRSGKIKHLLTEPLTDNYFSQTRMIGLTNTKLSKNWHIIYPENNPLFSKFGKQLPEIGKAAGGEALSFRFRGRAFGAYDIMGPGAGRIVVEVDGEIRDTVLRFDSYCTYWRMNYFIINNLEYKEHKVVLRVDGGSFDKAAILAKRGKTITDGSGYEDFNWYVGKIMIDGYLLVP